MIRVLNITPDQASEQLEAAYIVDKEIRFQAWNDQVRQDQEAEDPVGDRCPGSSFLFNRLLILIPVGGAVALLKSYMVHRDKIDGARAALLICKDGSFLYTLL